MTQTAKQLRSQHNTFLFNTETMCTGKISTASTEHVTLAHLEGRLLVKLEGGGGGGGVSRQLQFNSLGKQRLKNQRTSEWV